jgi:hypothetical protein
MRRIRPLTGWMICQYTTTPGRDESAGRQVA